MDDRHPSHLLRLRRCGPFSRGTWPPSLHTGLPARTHQNQLRPTIRAFWGTEQLASVRATLRSLMQRSPTDESSEHGGKDDERVLQAVLLGVLREPSNVSPNGTPDFAEY